MTPRSPIGVLVALIAAPVYALTSPMTSPAEAAGRAAESAGAAPIGSTSYSVPGGATFVSPSGNDANAGTQGAPVRTLGRALALVPAGGTIVMRGGSYNESNPVYKSITIQNYPGEAVWIDGSTPVSGFVQEGSVWRKDGWNVRFDHSPTYTKGAPDGTTAEWQFVNQSTAPMAAHPDQLFVGGKQLTQVKSRSLVKTGTFYLDEATSKLYIGTNPAAGVAASNIQQALNIRAANVTLRGIGIRRFATSVWQVGAVTLEKTGARLENVVITDTATTGLSVQSTGATLDRTTISYSGMLGIHGRYADNLTLNKVLSNNNNSERFNIAPVSGGIKLGSTRGVSVTDSAFRDNYGQGFWEDMSVYNTVIRGSDFTGNYGNGLFLEISARVIVGDSLFANNRIDGVKVNNTSNVKIWNNTFVGNGRAVNLVQDFRRNTNKSDPAVDARIAWPDPEMPWQLDSVTVSNNVIGLPAYTANCLICVEDYSAKESAEQMKITHNGNAFNRVNASTPTWIAIWSRGNVNPNPFIFTTLSAFTSTTGQESRGREFTGSSLISSSGAVSSTITSVSGQIALSLPSDVASAIGRPAGSQTLGAWGPSSPTQPPAPTPPPTTPPPTNPPSTPPTSGSTLASDNFSRTTSSGWGSADKGGAYTLNAGASQFAVGGGVAKVTLSSGQGYQAALKGVSSTSTDFIISTALDRPASGDGHFISLIGRQVGSSDYRMKVRVGADGKVAVWLLRSGSSDAYLASTVVNGVTLGSGETLKLRVQVTGTSPTTLRAKVWNTKTAEPSAWTLTASDSTADLQKAGSVAIYTYAAANMANGPVTVFYDSLQVTTA